MKAIEKFERLGTKMYTGQDVLKNHILTPHPILYTNDVTYYDQVLKYADTYKYVWLVEHNFKPLRTFPWYFKPEVDGIHFFPYVYKRSKKPKDWDKIRLVPTDAKFFSDEPILHRNIANEYDPYHGKDKFDIFFVGDCSTGTWDNLVSRGFNPTSVNSVADALDLSTTDLCWVVPDDVNVDPSFFFDYVPNDWSLGYIHVFSNGTIGQYDGIALFPKDTHVTDKEVKNRFYINKKEVVKVISSPMPYDVFNITTYKDYLQAFKNSKSDMFWATSDNISIDPTFSFDHVYFSHHNLYDRRQNHAFVHKVNDDKLYNGVFLCSKNKKLSKNEIEHRTLVNAKQWEIVASGPVVYEKFVINSYDDYQDALDNAKTEMFWGVKCLDKLSMLDDSSYINSELYSTRSQYLLNQYKKVNHAFVDSNTKDINFFLFSKQNKVSKKDIEQSYNSSVYLLHHYSECN